MSNRAGFLVKLKVYVRKLTKKSLKGLFRKNFSAPVFFNIFFVCSWCSVYHFQESQNSCSVEVQVLAVACRRFAMMRILENGAGWK